MKTRLFFVCNDAGRRALDVVGASGVIVLDTFAATHGDNIAGVNLGNARFSYLAHGDRFDLETRTLTPSVFKLAGSLLDPSAPCYKTEFDEPRWYADALIK